MNLTNFNFQRNGVSGNSFYSVIAENVFEEYPGKFLITWESNGDESLPDETCRVVYLEDTMQSWRGDEIGYEVGKELLKLKQKQQATHIYDLTHTL